MRTGAAGVIVGYGADAGSTTHEVLGIEVPMATAIADAAAARRDYLDETGGRYVHLVAYGDMMTGGDVAKAIACGADAVMLGEPLASRPRPRRVAGTGTRRPRTRSCRVGCASRDRPGRRRCGPLAEVLLGPTADAAGARNLFGGAAPGDGEVRLLAVKEFQKVELHGAGDRLTGRPRPV